MAFTSLNFLLFFALVILAYYLVPKKIQWLVLLIASYAFYLFSGVSQVVYIIWTTLFSYGAALYMQKIRTAFRAKADALGAGASRDQKRELKKAMDRRIHVVQVITVLVNLGVLAYVKYLDYFIGSLNNLFSLFKWDASIPMVNMIAPLGISYFTFNSVGYLVDVGRGKYDAERHLGKFALFVSFFPSIVQGPLNRFGDVGRQLQQPHKLEYDNLKFGSQLMLWGFFKKLVIADRVAPIVAAVFSSTDYTGSHIFFGILAYAFQIYCDFSGGIDITRGAAQMMGINLPVNFERPFFAKSMAEFWRRWHMSLGAWMREYVFYPISMSKRVRTVSKFFSERFGKHAGRIANAVPAPFVVFFLMNIWHGLGAQRVVNGLYHAVLISISVALEPVYEKLRVKLHINTQSFPFRLFQMVRTFLLISISRILVQAPSLGEGLKMIKALFTSVDLKFITGMDGAMFTDYGISRPAMVILLVAIAILWVVGILQERGVKIRQSLSKKKLIVRWGAVLLLLAFVLVFGVYGPEYDAKAFIYGGF